MPHEETARYKRERLEALRLFDKRSFRMLRRGTHRIVVGCPRGKWDTETRRCSVGMRAQGILHPLSEGNPCPMCQRAHMGFTW